MNYELKPPYLLFLGNAKDSLEAKSALGLTSFRKEKCLGQYRDKTCNADMGLPDLTIKEAAEKGAKTLILGIVNAGGYIEESWIKTIIEALSSGLDVAAGMHTYLSDIPEIKNAAQKHNQKLFDLRKPPENLKTGNGKKRKGNRLLTVGTDCAVGKMYTALLIEKEMQKRGLNADFRATGQTGIMIAGKGIAVDAVVADFIAGAAEALSPENHPDHWDIIEGQGSLYHAAFAGVSLGLLWGAQAQSLIMCHEPNRPHMRGLSDRHPPDLEACIHFTESCAKMADECAKIVGVSANTSKMGEKEALEWCEAESKRLGLIVIDPVRESAAPLVDAVLAQEKSIK